MAVPSVPSKTLYEIKYLISKLRLGLMRKGGLDDLLKAFL